MLLLFGKKGYFVYSSGRWFKSYNWLGQSQKKASSYLVKLLDEKVRDLISSFVDIKFHHIYQEFSQDADMLSKFSLQAIEGNIVFQVFHDDEMIDEGFIQLYQR